MVGLSAPAALRGWWPAAPDIALAAVCALLIAWSRFVPIADQWAPVLAAVASVALISRLGRELGWQSLGTSLRVVLWLSAAMLIGAAIDFEQFGFATVAGLCALSVGVDLWRFMEQMLGVAPASHAVLLLAYVGWQWQLWRRSAPGAVPLGVVLAIGVPGLFAGFWWLHMLDTEQLDSLARATGLTAGWWMWAGALIGTVPAEMLRHAGSATA